MTQDRLADDADALADLRTAPPGQRLVQQILVDAVSVLAAPFLGPGDPEPTLLAELGHEGAPLGRVDDLGHVLPGDVEDLRVVVFVEELLDVISESHLLRREIEVHASPFTAPAERTQRSKI
jgi:hypothetical protein